jgi:hypothetical protein
MSPMSEEPSTPRVAGRRLLRRGLALAVLGILAYLGQLAAHRYWMPWYLPVTGTLAALLVLTAAVQSRTLGRILAVVAVLLLAGFEWMFVLATLLPAYSGPVEVGRPFPAFRTIRADGTPFTAADLGGEQRDLLVFFRGRW